MTLDPHTLEVVARWLSMLDEFRVARAEMETPFSIKVQINDHLLTMKRRRAKQRKCEDCVHFVGSRGCGGMATHSDSKWERHNSHGNCGPSGKLWQDKHTEEK